jgi:hypothetical protein
MTELLANLYLDEDVSVEVARRGSWPTGFSRFSTVFPPMKWSTGSSIFDYFAACGQMVRVTKPVV